MENKEEKVVKETTKERYAARSRALRACGVRQQETSQGQGSGAGESADAAQSQPSQPFRQNGGHYYNNGNFRPQGNNSRPVMDARELGKLSVADLTKLAVNYNVDETSGLRKQQLIGKIIAVQAKQNGSVYGGGFLEILPDGFGFLRSEDNNYLSGAEDIYVSPSQIKRFGLRKGDKIEGLIRPPKEGERFFAMLQVQKVNDIEAEKIYNRPLFENLTPLHPNSRFAAFALNKCEKPRSISVYRPVRVCCMHICIIHV